MRYQQGTPVRVQIGLTEKIDRLPHLAWSGTGVVVNASMPPPYVYVVAVDGIDPRADLQGNRYLYREEEVWPQE